MFSTVQTLELSVFSSTAEVPLLFCSGAGTAICCSDTGFLTAVGNIANEKIVCRLVCGRSASKLGDLMKETALNVVVPSLGGFSWISVEIQLYKALNSHY